MPVARVLTPNIDGGADYATDNGNPFDMNDASDVLDMHDIAGASFGNGELTGVISGNDSYVELPLRTPFDPDIYHRFTADLCFDGAMNFADRPGGGMETRVVWFGASGAWTESQRIIPYPGCNQISIDMATDPAVAVNDEDTISKIGWRGQKINRLRLDLSEDYGPRRFWLRDVRFADDAAFDSTLSDPVPGGVRQRRHGGDLRDDRTGAFLDGTLLGRQGVGGGAVNTFTWNGTNASGAAMPNGTYWIYTVIRNGAGVATGYSRGRCACNVRSRRRRASSCRSARRASSTPATARAATSSR